MYYIVNRVAAENSLKKLFNFTLINWKEGHPEGGCTRILRN
jgi:hypothetical protein